MAVLTTLVGLLQLKHTQMEDNEDGTGSLESDIQLMDVSCALAAFDQHCKSDMTVLVSLDCFWPASWHHCACK